jgi:hypothetical protein
LLSPLSPETAIAGVEFILSLVDLFNRSLFKALRPLYLSPRTAAARQLSSFLEAPPPAAYCRQFPHGSSISPTLQSNFLMSPLANCSARLPRSRVLCWNVNHAPAAMITFQKEYAPPKNSTTTSPFQNRQEIPDLSRVIVYSGIPPR